MSLLYKKKEDLIYEADITQKGDIIYIDFYDDSGKHGACEAVDGYEMTTKQLLDILRNHENLQV